MPQAYYVAERLLVVAFVSYLGSIAVTLASAPLRGRETLQRAARWLALGGLCVHGLGLLARWVANAQVEIYEQALSQGQALATSEWIRAALRHPPFASLHESLLFVAFALVATWAAARLRFRFPSSGLFALTLAALALAVASLASDRQVSPLEPALRSWWILAHAGLLLVSYSLLALAAGAALLLLLKLDVPTPELGKWLAAAAAFLTLLAGGRWDRIPELVLHGDFVMSPVVTVGGRTQAASFLPPGADKAVPWTLALPGVGPWLLAAIGLFAAAAVLFRRERGAARPLRASGGAWALGAGALALLGGLLTVAWNVAAMEPIPASAAPGPLAGGATFARLSWTANQYAPAVLALVVLACAAFLVAAARRPSLAAALPDEERLDEVVYRAIAVAFPLLSLGILAGAAWAQKSWGRAWGWDPKETFALVTWLVYAAYLHTRVALGWTGKPGAVIAAAGLAAAAFTYVGVSLGLAGQGLHVFGAG